jgi:hypothetical protein
MSTNKKRLWVFFTILVYVVIAVAGFFIAYFIKEAIFQKQQIDPPPTPIMSNITPVPKPSDWRVYANSSYKLKFSYPPQDTIKSKSYGFGVTSLILDTTNGTLDFQILIMPKTLASAVGQNFDGYYTMPDNTSKVIKSPMSSDNTTETFTKIRDRSVNGNQAIDYQSISSNAQKGTQPEIGTFIQTGDNLVLISTGKSNKMKLEQLLSSFTYPN